jgi:hypothetical protein
VVAHAHNGEGTMTNTATPNECEPIEGPLADDELNAVNAGMLYLKPTGGMADRGIESLASTILERLGNAMAVGSSTDRGSG